MIYFDIYCAIAALYLVIGMSDQEARKEFLDAFDNVAWRFGYPAAAIAGTIACAIAAMLWPVYLVVELIQRWCER